MSSPDAALPPSCATPLSRSYRRKARVHGRARGRSEDTVPCAARWWNERVEEFLRWQDEQDDLDKVTRTHRRLDLRRWPTMCRRAGVRPPSSPWRVTAEQVRAVKECGLWRVSTLKPILCAFRQFIRWASKKPKQKGAKALAVLADRASLWALPSGEEDRRNWVSEDQLNGLFDASADRVRVRVVLQGYAGLRECEVRSLRVGDLRLDATPPRMNVRGKGRHGGKLRPVPICPTALAVLKEWTVGMDPSAKVYPIGHSQADADLRELGKVVGLPFPLSGHVLRRSYGRIAYHAGTPPGRIRRVYGHASVEQTLHYIGVEVEAEAEDAERFDAHLSSFRSGDETPSEV